jgi:hypothetical protein
MPHHSTLRGLATTALALSVFICTVTVIVYIQTNEFAFFDLGEFGIDGAIKAILFLGLPLGVVTSSAFGYYHWKGVVPTWAALALSSLALVATALLCLTA